MSDEERVERADLDKLWREATKELEETRKQLAHARAAVKLVAKERDALLKIGTLAPWQIEGLAPANTQQTASSPSREKTLVEVFDFDALSPEQRQEHLRQAALALGLDNPKENP